MKTTFIFVGVLLLSLLLMVSCGTSNTDVPIPFVAVTVFPATGTLDQGASLQFAANVTGTSNTRVTWSVAEASGGTIDAQGVYTAPTRLGLFHVTATSVANPAVRSSSAVMVNAVSLNITPVSYEVSPGEILQFAVTVTGTVHPEVTWTVQEGADGGSINGAGVYTAPSSSGVFHVVATSATDSTASMSVPVNVDNLAVRITPGSLMLLPGSKRSLSANVTGCMDDRVAWTVLEGTAGGSITSEGVYTAPLAVGEYHIVATSLAHAGIANTAAVIVKNSGFTDAGDMISARSFHSATLLPNGDVLLAGGNSDTEPETATAELFDHGTGVFRSTGQMGQARFAHTATLLPNGKVLIAGGNIDGGFGWISLDSAELYDPASGQFTATGTMNARRASHTATLLADGKVLIVGGYWCDEPVESAELYDPATGMFTPTGSMRSVRGDHTATLLPDDRVLIAGGWTWDNQDRVEIYDPSARTFTPLDSSLGRYMHTATLLDDGRILFVGGLSWAWYSSEATFFDDARYLNVATGQFTQASQMSEIRYGHTATTLKDGKILVTGGWNSTKSTNTTELFVPATSSFANGGTMNAARAGHRATLLGNGRVLVTGGSSSKTAELYIPE